MSSVNTKSGSHTARIKSTYLDSGNYEEQHVQKKFQPICDTMHSRSEQELGFEPSDITARSLALLAGQLRAFVEITLGRDADPSTRTITKFPHKFFIDYRPEGALYVILRACLNFKYLHGLRRFEFTNPDRRSSNFDLLLRIEKSLKEAHMLPVVKVFFVRAIPASSQPALRAIVQKRGTVVSSASSATHIVYPDPTGTTVAETTGTDYCRPLELKEDIALVHWWYHPDSYDSWISRADVDGEPEQAEDHASPWHVQRRWLEDTDMFNEWMNEADYEIPLEKRIEVIPPPKGENARATNTTTVPGKDTQRETNTEKPDKPIKKRKRMASSVSTKMQKDSVSEHEYRPAKPEDSAQSNSSNESDEVPTPRRSRKGADQRDRKSKDDQIRRSNEASGGHQRKRARLSEESRRTSAKTKSVKLRLSLKAPPERSKNRTKESRIRTSSKNERREASADSRGGTLKVRIPAAGRISAMTASKGSQKAHGKDDEDGMSISSADEMPIASRMEGVGKRRSERKEKKDQRGGDGNKSEGGIVSKPDQNGMAGEEEGVEQRRPFSRRKSRKKERIQQMRLAGVTAVEDALPIPEGELPRIRNISNEGVDQDTLKTRKPRGQVSGNISDSGMAKAEESKKDGEEKEKGQSSGAVKDENRMDIDEKAANGRAMAISEKMLTDASNVPPSAADLVESLPNVTIRMPAHSRWFRTDAIHDIEKRSLPEFFNNRTESKTPLVYKKYRDFMIDVWRQNPEKYLTATAVRRHLAGDVCAILRVHAFLEHWGLINFGTEPESKPHLNSSMRSRYSRPKPIFLDGHVRDQVNGVPRLLFFDEPRLSKRENGPVSLQKAIKQVKEKNMRERAGSSVLSRRELYATAAATKYECDMCDADCSKMRYHCVSGADMELCPNCFANGRYPETLTARDFEQLTSVLGSEAHDGSVWSEAEVLLLLEGLEKYGDDWNQVAEHVGTKSNEQCVLQFLRMPIEDSFLGDQLGKWEVRGDEEGAVDVRQEGEFDGKHKFGGAMLPFADTANPILAQVAFLAASVSPEVAAAAAQAALQEIMSECGGKSIAGGDMSQTGQAKALMQESNRRRAEVGQDGGHGKAGASNDEGSNLANLPRTKLDAVAVEGAAAVGLGAAATKARKTGGRGNERD
ncbi:SWI/SNF and RSC complexes subunit ssr2 [Gracilariopsis chorda]|uniref:SWI/SNF and RSC complexes subunit ssr2 n=1 Tax=Gracilariopsis chorda TaxID=448386 RepID=A0A2V3IQX8_9FLOR|nr:SWI/SNF and RSC complexes subunit ssr2 [Gracilariopsis chorda]|eukprot:PXF43560.1 SWI/SNF and RSC complexes subunit ssr2 [Gracilariopsis chorda]